MMSEANSIFIRRESNVRSYCRSFSVVFDKASGSHMWDEDGRQYIDFFSGAGALNYGHNHPIFRDKMIEYLMQNSINHALDLHTCAKRDFLNSFEKIILKPRSMPHKIMFPGPTGTNAVEAAMKIARLVTGREKIAAFTNGFHGMTLGALAATGNKYGRNGAGTTLPNIDRYPYDGYFGNEINTVDMIEHFLEDPSSGYEPPAAFLLETIQAEGGINVARNEWLRQLTRLAKKIGSLIIVDDIQVGCGRTGNFFSFDEMEICPDIICLSKSISGFGLPMSLVLMMPEYDMFLPGQHNGTFRGNSLAFVAAEQAIQLWESVDFISDIQRNSQAVSVGLANIQRLCGEGFSVRGKGMIQGLKCPSSEIADLITKNAFKEGLIVETCGPRGEVIKLLPAINIPTSILQEGIKILSNSVLAFAAIKEHETV